MINNIIAIDMNIIMYPCIKLYQNYCNEKESPVMIWNRLQEELNIDQFLSFDADIYRNIINYIRFNLKNNDSKLIPVKEEKEIVDYLKKNTNFEKDKYAIEVIDFFFDIWKTEQDTYELTGFDKYNSSDWLGYLYINEKVAECYWYKAPNSDTNIDMNTNKQEYPVMVSARDLDNYKYKDDKPQYIFVSLSPQYLPYKYRYLYDIILDMLKEV